MGLLKGHLPKLKFSRWHIRSADVKDTENQPLYPLTVLPLSSYPLLSLSFSSSFSLSLTSRHGAAVARRRDPVVTVAKRAWLTVARSWSPPVVAAKREGGVAMTQRRGLATLLIYYCLLLLTTPVAAEPREAVSEDSGVGWRRRPRQGQWLTHRWRWQLRPSLGEVDP